MIRTRRCNERAIGWQAERQTSDPGCVGALRTLKLSLYEIVVWYHSRNVDLWSIASYWCMEGEGDRACSRGVPGFALGSRQLLVDMDSVAGDRRIELEFGTARRPLGLRGSGRGVRCLEKAESRTGQRQGKNTRSSFGRGSGLIRWHTSQRSET
ncbi:hypothetical protein LZ31DRAFT_555482 [Colletotrichum somersetense]|nr:hypothetical protein LZ31DRAFT_555482 [Colletotrichum somersetense]